MNASPAPELDVPNLTVDDSVAEVVRLCTERGEPASKAAGEVAGWFDVGPTARELIRQGLQYLANNELHDRRGRRGDHGSEGDKVAAPPASGGPGGTPSLRAETEHFMMLRRITLQTADGERAMPLIRLSIDDHAANADRYRAQEIGARKKRKWCERAVKSCRSAGVERIADLTPETRDKLEGLAREAWS